MTALTTRRRIDRCVGESMSSRVDDLAVESPLALIVDGTVLATTMRTPGHDLELAAGWLVAEAGVRSRDEILGLAACPAGVARPGRTLAGVDAVRIRLAGSVDAPQPRLSITSSSCGACGPSELRMPAPVGRAAPLGWSVRADAIRHYPERMRQRQNGFERAGSLHAAAVVDPSGGDVEQDVSVVREDVGRHNAVDKAVGALLLAGRLPLRGHVLVVSGRVSFEIVQKALAASMAAIVAVSAPTSLAVDLAVAHGLLLVGMCRDGGMNVYANAEAVTW